MEACWSCVVVWWVKLFIWWIQLAYSSVWSSISWLSWLFHIIFLTSFLSSRHLFSFSPIFSTLLSSPLVSFFCLLPLSPLLPWYAVYLFLRSLFLFPPCNHFYSSHWFYLISFLFFSPCPSFLPTRRSLVTNRALTGLSPNAFASTLY